MTCHVCKKPIQGRPRFVCEACMWENIIYDKPLNKSFSEWRERQQGATPRNEASDYSAPFSNDDAFFLRSIGIDPQ